MEILTKEEDEGKVNRRFPYGRQYWLESRG